ncbi:MAG: helix-turn-helix domain-containing protein [Thermoleophilia bacterium]
MEELWDIRRVARLLGLSERTVYQMVRDGRLPARRVGGRWRFRPEEIDQWIDDSATGNPERVEPVKSRGPDHKLLGRRELQDVLGRIEDRLERRLAFVALLAAANTARGWLPPIVVGGHAVEFYTAGGYATVDIDLVSAHEPLEQVLPEWGFVARGRHWLHEGLGLVVEAPASHLDPGQRERVTRVEIVGEIAYILGVEDVIVDRLAACVHRRSEEDCRWAAVLVGLFADRMDRDYLIERSRFAEVDERLMTLLDVPEPNGDPT